MKSKVLAGLVLPCALLGACAGSSDGEASGNGSAGAGNALPQSGSSSAAGAQASAGAASNHGGASASTGGTPNGGGGASGGGHPTAGESSTGNGGAVSGGGVGNAGAPNAGSGNGSAGAPAGTSPLKGLAFNLMGSSCDDLKTLGLSWYYAWSGNAPCVNGPEFVPQIWGSWKKLDWVPTPAKAVSKGAKYLLGFNEPDGAGQANLSVDDAIALWPDFNQPGVLVGSPAVAGQEDWLPSFMAQVAAKNLRVDFIAIHWYGWNAGSCNDVKAFEGKIKWAEQWQRPIWVTEWSCRLQSVAVNQKFYADALVMLKKHPLVQRYGWFLSRSAGEFVNAALLDSSGKPTVLGGAYVAAPAMR